MPYSISLKPPKHRVVFDVDKDLYEAFIRLHPTRGAVTTFFTRQLSAYVKRREETGQKFLGLTNEESPSP